ncbi:fungal-specific transcription factor domain-containing protein [Plectosphaerella plurivora]|uniref:Fungal-specific transcription factor domain-containing protein n=1 Tax=Plectosphaerella plurivora TaxID=936078 RepID=A0A9P8VD06_9PEZI|nr:fungal-specific transcription factor domain-containing protein [Plectosphaerella plurivora]
MGHDRDHGDSDCVEVAQARGDRGHDSGKGERRPSHSTSVDEGGKKKGDKRTNEGTSPEPSESGAKKMKRGKYISRACTSCQQRKVKCDGGEPCTNCIARDQACIFAARGSVNTAELLARLLDVERRLSLISKPEDSLYKPAKPLAKTDLQAVMESDGQTFVGEISMSPGLEDGDDKIDGQPRRPIEYSSRSPLHNTDPSGDRSSRKIRAWLEPLLEQHGVVADEVEWRRYMHIFFDEIHVLYPFLHPPSVWETFNELWEFSALWPMTSPAEREHKRMSVALVVGMSLLQDAEEMSNTAAKSLLALQTLLVRVIYLFRLDATQRAARLLALAVCNAHIIGLNRQCTLDSMPIFSSQMFNRAWWCIYVLDRRLGLESGRPCIIQDSNVDTTPPVNLGDEWLTRYLSRTEKPAQLQREIALEVAANRVTSMPYLQAMVRYSKVVGKVWELLYGIKGSRSNSSAMVEYADTVLCNLLEVLPESLSYDPNVAGDVQFSTRLRWQVKQTMLLYICTHFLRLLVRRPFSQVTPPMSGGEDDDFESVTVCAGLADSILSAHDNIQDDELKYSFPFSHYLTSASMVMISLVTREPKLKRRHRYTIMAATRSLNIYCHRIWVSGKMMRWVSKLTSLVQRTLGEEDPPRQFSVSGQESGLQQQQQQQQQLTPRSDQGVNTGGTSYPQQSMATPGFKAGQVDLDGSAPWMMASDMQPAELPEWVMSDFNFETIIAGESGNSAKMGGSIQGPMTSQDDGGSLLRASNVDVDELMFGALGPNGIFNLDMDLDQTGVNMF